MSDLALHQTEGQAGSGEAGKLRLAPGRGQVEKLARALPHSKCELLPKQTLHPTCGQSGHSYALNRVSNSKASLGNNGRGRGHRHQSASSKMHSVRSQSFIVGNHIFDNHGPRFPLTNHQLADSGRSGMSGRLRLRAGRVGSTGGVQMKKKKIDGQEWVSVPTKQCHDMIAIPLPGLNDPSLVSNPTRSPTAWEEPQAPKSSAPGQTAQLPFPALFVVTLVPQVKVGV